MKFVQFEIEKMKEKLKNDMCSLIYINYENLNGKIKLDKICKEKGIKVFGNEKNVLNSLTEEDLKDFYKIYIFNEKFMITVYKFEENDYRYSKILSSDFDNDEEITERDILLEKQDFQRLKIKIGKQKGSKTEIVQFMEFLGGGNSDKR